jgi:hypothetical protein
LKRKKDDAEERNRQDSLNRKVQRARQFEEDEKRNRIERENAKKIHESLKRKNDEAEAEQDHRTRMDVVDSSLYKNNKTKKNRRRSNLIDTKRRRNHRTKIIDDFMKNKTAKRRDLLDKFRSRNDI